MSKPTAILLLLKAVVVSGLNYVERETPSGTIRGYVTEYNLFEVENYMGIPYAKPPVGKLRFKRPVPIGSHGAVDATRLPPACPQYSQHDFPWYDSTSHQSEDCLYLNIWVPENTPTGSKRGVLMWIHGGGAFSTGSTRQDVYNATSYAALETSDSDDDIVTVTVNYRLGVFGFFTTGTEEAPGNVGIYDMVLALKWIRENIAAFGGDPDKITLAGQGSGSIAISLLTLSPAMNGMFQNAILQSGTFYSFPKRSVEDNLAVSRALADDIGCLSRGKDIRDDPERVLECMRNKKANDLILAMDFVDELLGLTFLPHYGDGLIPDDPLAELKSGNVNDVSVLIGTTSEEGSHLLTTSYPDEFGGVFGRHSNGEIERDRAKSILKEEFRSYPDPDGIADFYLNGGGGESSKSSAVARVIQAIGDSRVLCPILYFAERFSIKREVYFYFYDFQPSRAYRLWAEWMGVVHFEEVPLVFGVPLRRYAEHRSSLPGNDGSHSYSNQLQWASFVRTGKPADKRWTRFSRGAPNFYQMKRRFFWGHTAPHNKSCTFLRKYLE